MERGEPTITVYTFRLPQDSEPERTMQYPDADGADITGDAYQEDSAYRVEALDDDTVIAGVARDETGKWYRQQSLGHLVTSALSLNEYVTWRNAMKALDVGDFRELDD